MTVGKTVVWISGASFGIGAGLARKVPWPDARIINLDIKPSPLYETITFDLTQPDTWDAVRLHFETEFAGFRKQGVTRAIFMVVGHVDLGSGLAAKIAAQDYRTALIANAVGPLALANDFLRCLSVYDGELESGLMLMSSGAAHAKLVGQSAYGAAKAGIEHWVRVMERELAETGRKTWITAVRPGLVDTPAARAATRMDPAVYPRAPKMTKLLDRFGVTEDEAAERIWKALPPKADETLISFDDAPPPVRGNGTA